MCTLKYIIVRHILLPIAQSYCTAMKTSEVYAKIGTIRHLCTCYALISVERKSQDNLAYLFREKNLKPDERRYHRSKQNTFYLLSEVLLDSVIISYINIWDFH